MNNKKRKKKGEYLSYIEETPKHFEVLRKVASKATKKAVIATKAKKLPVTYKSGSDIIREYSNGRKEIIGAINQPSIRVVKGAKFKLD